MRNIQLCHYVSFRFFVRLWPRRKTAFIWSNKCWKITSFCSRHQKWGQTSGCVSRQLQRRTPFFLLLTNTDTPLHTDRCSITLSTGDTAHYLLIASPFFCNTGADRSTVMDSFSQTAVQRSQWKPPRSQGQSDDVPNRGFNSAHHHGDAPIRDGSRSYSPHTLCLCVPLSSCPSVCRFRSFLSSTSRFWSTLQSLCFIFPFSSPPLYHSSRLADR